MPMGWSAFTDYLIGEGLGPTTRSIYVSKARAADGWMAARGSTLADASPTLISEYVEAHVAFSHSSRGQVAAAFSRYWAHVGRADAPRGAIRVPPAPEMVCRAIDEDAARDVVKVATGWHPEGLAVLAGMYLALRRFEIAKMEWARFDSELAWYTVTGKYDKTARLPVHPHLADELEQARAGGARSGWVFPGRISGPVAAATVWEWVKRVGAAAGVDDLKPHELRHTALATANDRTGNLRAVQTFARHSKPGTTSGYTRTTAARLREVSDALDYV